MYATWLRIVLFVEAGAKAPFSCSFFHRAKARCFYPFQSLYASTCSIPLCFYSYSHCQFSVAESELFKSIRSLCVFSGFQHWIVRPANHFVQGRASSDHRIHRVFLFDEEVDE